MRIKPKTDNSSDNNIFWVTMTDLMTALVLVFMILFFYTYMTSFYEHFEQSSEQIKAFRSLEEVLNQQNIRAELVGNVQSNEKNNKNDKNTKSKIKKGNKTDEKTVENQTQKIKRFKKKKIKDKKGLKSEEKIDIKELVKEKYEDISENVSGKFKAVIEKITNKEPKEISKQTTDNKVKKESEASMPQKAEVTIDASSGIVKISDLELFDVDSYELSDKGKKYLAKFTPAYLDSLFTNEYLKDHIDKIIIQGHTDSQTYKGEYSADEQYMKNMELSLKRAYTVANYMTSTPYNKINGEKLRKMIIVEGASYSNPVMTGGKEDYAKSRRVELKIVMKEKNKYKESLNKNS